MTGYYDEPLGLDDQQLERLADLLAIKLAALRPGVRQMLTVEDIATTFKVSKAWVYENAPRLGGVKLGPGERAPLRFDADTVAAALTPLGGDAKPATNFRGPVQRRRRPRHKPEHLHPVYDG